MVDARVGHPLGQVLLVGEGNGFCPEAGWISVCLYRYQARNFCKLAGPMISISHASYSRCEGNTVAL